MEQKKISTLKYFSMKNLKNRKPDREILQGLSKNTFYKKFFFL